MNAVEIAKIYLRSIVFIMTSWIGTVVYGIYVNPVGDQVLMALIAAGVAVVVFEKPTVAAE